MTPDAMALAALLVAGHSLADFLFQTSWMVENKARARGLLAHVGVVALCHLATLAPFFGMPAVAATVAIALAHLLIDRTKITLGRRFPGGARTWFYVDQLAHLLVLAAAWWWLAPRLPAVPLLASPELLLTLGAIAAVYAFNVNGMSAIVQLELDRLGIAPQEDGPAVGRTIGILERIFAVTLVLLNRWEALGLLVAAKSLARFKDLDDRRRAEYYLVGTLVSLLGATGSGLLLRFLLGRGAGPGP